jgi:hypothetical protein
MGRCPVVIGTNVPWIYIFSSSIFIELIKIINNDESVLSLARIDFTVPVCLLPELAFASLILKRLWFRIPPGPLNYPNGLGDFVLTCLLLGDKELELVRKNRGQRIIEELNQRLCPDLDYLILNQLVAGYCPNKPLVERSSRSTLKNAGTWR